MSLRSKGKVNVAAIAERLGGGGHENLAGCSVAGPLDCAIETILVELRRGVAELIAEKA
jgi:phosphoesterase RecJ-like protein